MRTLLHPDVEEELFDAIGRYEDQKPGLGEELEREAHRLLVAVAEAPKLWPVWPGAPVREPPVRRAVLARFPYAIAYQALPDRVVVLAFAHTSRRPFYWSTRRL